MGVETRRLARRETAGLATKEETANEARDSWGATAPARSECAIARPDPVWCLQENNCGDVGGFQLLKECTAWIIQTERHGAAVDLTGEIERIDGQ